jgi:hypothetical protein
MPEYSRSDPLNCDGSKILLTIREFSLYIYNSQTFALEKRLSNYHGGTIPAHTEGGNEPRWDDEDPNVFYYVSGMGFYKYDLRNDTSTLIRNFSTDFPDGYWVGNDAEGEPSMDRRYWGFFVRGLPPEYPNYVKFVAFTYDMVEDIIIGTLPQDNQYDVNPGGNTITISPFGKRVIIEHFGSTPTRSYNLDFTNPVDLGLDGHSDLAIDAENNEVHVIKDDQYDWIAMLDVNTGQRTNLLKLPMTDSWDIEPGILISGSNYNKPGWVVISTYAGDSGAWAYNQIFLLESPKAAISQDGTRIYFVSNWEVGEGDIDTYEIKLPETWWEDLGGTVNSSHLSPNISPKGYELYQNYPNPFNPTTTISFDVAESSNVRLTIYDSTGKEVRILTRETKSPGSYSVLWDGTNKAGQKIASGVYFYKLEIFNKTNNIIFSKTQKMVLLN